MAADSGVGSLTAARRQRGSVAAWQRGSVAAWQLVAALAAWWCWQPGDGSGGSIAGSSIFQRELRKNKEESKIVNVS